MKQRTRWSRVLGMTQTLLLSGTLLASLALPRALAQGVTHVYSFTASGGKHPNAGLVQDGGGIFYGTTELGGANSVGAVFKIDTDGTVSTLYSCSTANGSTPYGGLVLGNDGNLYGTTYYGGGARKRGTIFKVTPAGVFTKLFSFDERSGDGYNPYAGLVLGSDGNLYGTTENGEGSSGTVFQISTSGTFDELHEFTGLNSGNSHSTLVEGAAGTFFGATVNGGTGGKGTLFQVTSAGVHTTLHNFNTANGANPSGALARDDDGNLYGTTENGGANGVGTVFKRAANGTFTTLHSFNTTDGANPIGGLELGSDGQLYGTTTSGGANGLGVVFQISPLGGLNVLHSFAGTEGTNPKGKLLESNDNLLYGTAYNGGENGFGSVFKLNQANSRITVGARTGALTQPVTFRAAVWNAQNGDRLAGKWLHFSIGTMPIGSALSNAMGLAELTYALPIDLPLGENVLHVSYDGDLIYGARTGVGILTVEKANVAILVGKREGRAGDRLTFSARLTNTSASPDGPVAGRLLTFKVGDTELGSGLTNASGYAYVTARIPNLEPGDYDIVVSFAGDKQFSVGEGTRTLTVLP